jgi:hypothetical protein
LREYFILLIKIESNHYHLAAELILKGRSLPPSLYPSKVQACLALSAVWKSTKADPFERPVSSLSRRTFTGWRPF